MWKFTVITRLDSWPRNSWFCYTCVGSITMSPFKTSPIASEKCPCPQRVMKPLTILNEGWQNPIQESNKICNLQWGLQILDCWIYDSLFLLLFFVVNTCSQLWLLCAYTVVWAVAGEKFKMTVFTISFPSISVVIDYFSHSCARLTKHKLDATFLDFLGQHSVII